MKTNHINKTQLLPYPPSENVIGQSRFRISKHEHFKHKNIRATEILKNFTIIHTLKINHINGIQ